MIVRLILHVEVTSNLRRLREDVLLYTPRSSVSRLEIIYSYSFPSFFTQHRQSPKQSSGTARIAHETFAAMANWFAQSQYIPSARVKKKSTSHATKNYDVEGKDVNRPIIQSTRPVRSASYPQNLQYTRLHVDGEL